MSQVPQIPGDLDQKDLINATNNVARELNARETVQIFKDDTGTRRVLLGKGNDGFYGIKVSQSGSDVFTAEDDDLVMSSEFNLMRIVSSGSATVTLANPVTHFSITTTDVAHGLGFAPVFVAYCTLDASLGGELIQLPRTGFDVLGNFAFSASATVDSTNISFHVQPNDASVYDGTVWTFKYYLFQETAN